MPTIDANYIFIPGPGVLMRQTYTATIANQFKRMSTFGATGGLKITTNREIIEWEEGSPLQVVVRDVLREKGEVEIILAEKALEDVLVELGDGTVVQEAADAAVTEEHHLYLRGYGWQVVPGVRYGTTAHPTTINSLTSADATLVPYTVTDDYQIGNVEGSLAVEIVPDGAIDPGDDSIVEVIINVTFYQPKRKYLSCGGRNNLAYNHLKTTKLFRDGIRREFVECYKSTTSGTLEEDYSKTGYSERTCKFALISDTTRTIGDRLWRKYQELE